MNDIDDMKESLTNHIELGASAKSLLRNKAYQAVFLAIKGEIISSIGASDFNEQEKREHLFRLMQTVSKVEGFISVCINDGVIAKQDLQNLLNEVN